MWHRHRGGGQPRSPKAHNPPHAPCLLLLPRRRGMLAQPCFMVWRYRIPGWAIFSFFYFFFLIYRQPQARPRGVKLLRSSSLPIPTRCLTSRPVRLLQRVQGWGEGTQPPAPALPPTPMSSWAFCIQGSEEFGGVLLSSSRCPAGFAGRGGTDLCWGAWGESGWMGTALTSPGTLSSANTTGLGLCSKEGPGNICIKNKYTPPKHSPTLQEENEGGKKATIQRKKTTSNLTHLCCASVWKVRTSKLYFFY